MTEADAVAAVIGSFGTPELQASTQAAQTVASPETPAQQVQQPTAPQQPAPVAPNPQTQVTQEQPQTDSFTGIDPNALAPELQALYKSMQGDYTRSKQEIAEYRKAFEGLGDGVDPGAVVQAYQFVQALDTDPNYQLQVFNYMQDQLAQRGLLGNNAPTGTVEAPDQGFSDWQADDDGGLPPHVQAMVEQAQNQLNQIQQERALMETAMSMQRQESEIREANPTYKKGDFDAIYSLSFSTNGDLHKAQAQWESYRQSIVSDLIGAKDATVNTAGPTQNPGPAATPQKFANLDEAEAAAAEYVRNAAANGLFG